MQKKRVIVVTFVWREMKSMEKMAFKCGVRRLENHPFAVVHPQSYSIEYLKEKYPRIIDMPMADMNFKSVDSYNEMMLTPEFYQSFSDYEYMLIYQLDAFVFEDKLDYWVSQGYDYVGAPWLPKSDSWLQYAVGDIVIKVLKLFPIINNRVHHPHKYFEVGNGGFSLRRIPTMIRILTESKEEIKRLPKGSLERKEDIAISLLLGKKYKLKIPNWRTAAFFSFEYNPNRCYRVTDGHLPFGCHAWNSRNWELFWRGRLWYRE